MCRKFNVLFRQDIPYDFVQMRRTHIKVDIGAGRRIGKKLRMDHHTKLFSKLFTGNFTEVSAVSAKKRNESCNQPHMICFSRLRRSSAA